MPDKILTPFGKDDYEITNQELLYQGVFRLSRYHLKHRKFTGGWSKVFTREIFERPSAAAVLPYDPVLSRVVLIEQFRAGALAAPQSPWLVEIVAGLYSKDESPQDVVRRESIEEAGSEILDIHPICEYFVSPGGSNEYLKLFVGRANAAQPEGFFGLDEENEDIRAFSVPSKKAFEMVKDGTIKTSPAIIALQWLQINQEWLNNLWQTS